MPSGTTVRVRSVVVLASVALLAGATFATVPAIAVSATAFVRVNQVGYPTASAKRAFLMASDVETGATFSVRAGGSAVFSGSVGADLGAWSTAYPHVYALDFTSFSTTGDLFDRCGRPHPRQLREHARRRRGRHRGDRGGRR